MVDRESKVWPTAKAIAPYTQGQITQCCQINNDQDYLPFVFDRRIPASSKHAVITGVPGLTPPPPITLITTTTTITSTTTSTTTTTTIIMIIITTTIIIIIMMMMMMMMIIIIIIIIMIIIIIIIMSVFLEHIST